MVSRNFSKKSADRMRLIAAYLFAFLAVFFRRTTGKMPIVIATLICPVEFLNWTMILPDLSKCRLQTRQSMLRIIFA